jgi:hypothetical protein
MLAGTLLLGCQNEAPAPAMTSPQDAPAATPEPVESTAEPTAEPRVPVLLVTDREALAAMPQLGYDSVVVGRRAVSTSQLSEDAGFASIVKVLEKDLAADAKKDKRAGVGMRHPHRQFDIRWLSAPNVRLDLVAVANRLDRIPFESAHCGETRLIYRLAYDAKLEGKDVTSRLPMTFNVVFWQDGPDCQSVANRWMLPQAGATRLAESLTGAQGPLAPERLSRTQLKSVEVDMQSVRWPAAVHPKMGGHAEYTLRVFKRKGEVFVPSPLENTPDVRRLRKDDALRAELLAWLRDGDQLQAIDDGTVIIPDKFLATRGASVTPRGFARRANRAFVQLFSEREFEGLGYEGLEHARSPAALLRRLDGLTCGGCHESRSVAGFHVLGADEPKQVLDALAVPISPHLTGDLPRRERYLLAVATGQTGNETRPLSEHDAAPGAYGTHCGLGDPGFAQFRCNDEFRCMALDDEQMGICVPVTPGAGDPCEVGRMRASANPHADRVVDVKRIACNHAVCNSNPVGFPQGMCTKNCDGLGDDESCGAIVSLRPFNDCVAKRRPFGDCVIETANPAGMRACDENRPCRDDYICARTPNDEGGVCIPPYFLFQLRVDGHVM